VTSRLGEKEINLWDKIKFDSFYPKNFLPWVKRIFLGYKKKPDLNLAQRLIKSFPPRRLVTIYPNMVKKTFYPK